MTDAYSLIKFHVCPFQLSVLNHQGNHSLELWNCLFLLLFIRVEAQTYYNAKVLNTLECTSVSLESECRRNYVSELGVVLSWTMSWQLQVFAIIVMSIQYSTVLWNCVTSIVHANPSESTCLYLHSLHVIMLLIFNFLPELTDTAKKDHSCSHAYQFLVDEFTTQHLIGTYTKPIVALADGFCMGGVSKPGALILTYI